MGKRRDLIRKVPRRIASIRFLPTILTCVGITVVAADEGGLLPRTWRLTSLALLALVAAALIGRERIAVRRREWIVLAALAGFALWVAASKYWSRLPADALPEAERNLLYLICVAAIVFGIKRAWLPALLAGALAGITAVSAYGLVDYAFSRPPLNPFQGSLLFEPFGYANAFGIFAALGIVLSVGLALSADSGRKRLIAVSPNAVLVPTLYFTSSRGAWVVLPVGIVTVLYVGGHLRSRLALGALLAAGLAAAAVFGSAGDQRLSLFGENRPGYWSVAWRDVKENPLLGSGAGTFGDYWLEHPASGGYAHDAHNLYLETLAELGPLGLALVVTALAVPLLGLGERRDAVTAAAAGAYVAFVLHAAVDWDWEFSAVTLTGLLCGAAVLVASRAETTSALALRLRAALGGVVVLLAVFVVYRLATSHQLWPG